MATYPYEVSPSLRELFPTAFDGLLQLPDDSLLDRLRLTSFEDTPYYLGGRIRGTLAYPASLGFELPWTSAIEIVFLQKVGHTITEVDFELEVWTDDFACRLKDVNLGVRFRSELIKPAKKEQGQWIIDPALDYVQIDALISIAAGMEGVYLDGAPALSIPPFVIGNSGVVVEASLVRWIFRQRDAIGLPASLGENPRGVFIEKAAIHLPKALSGILPNDVTLTDLFIGSGGFSGKVEGSWAPTLKSDKSGFQGTGAGDLLGIPFGLKTVSLELVQNTFKEATIAGQILLPFFDQAINVDISFDLDGGLTVALSALQPPGVDTTAGLKLTKTGLLDMTIDSMQFEIDHGVMTVKLAGEIKPLVGGLDWPAFHIDQLSIDSEGHLSLTGGWVDLPQGYTLDLFAFKLEITKFGAGRDDNGNQFIGFNGGLDLIKGIPAGASVEGLRITWGPTILQPQLSVKGVGVELTIPDKLHFKGEVSYEELGDLKAFTGAILLELPAVNGLTVDGKIVFGSTKDPVTQKRFKYFAIYLEGEFGTGIPLWASGLALNGLAGLFAVEYGPDKPNDWEWYSMDKSKSWFHKPPIGVTDIIRKWAPQNGTWAIGAGASIATYADGGNLFNGRFLLLLVFPGPVFMIDGRGNFLSKPTADKEPLFHALVVLDVKAGYFLIGLDAQWKYDKEDGKLVQIAGSAETFFNFNDPGDWHIYIGKDTPMEQRIRASFAGGFQANAYFMLDPRALRIGVWIGKNEHYRFGPVGADLEAWLDANATLSFRPPHLAASVWLHGLLGVKVFRWKFAIGLDARLEADVAKPFHILGSVAIRIETRFKDFEFEVRIEYGPRPVRPQIPPDVPDAFMKSGVAHLKSTIEWPLLADGNSSDRGPSVPLDGRPYLMFEQPVHDATGVSVNPAPDPGWITIGDRTTSKAVARVKYELKTVLLERTKATGGWEPYPHKLYGAWGAAPPNPGNGGTQNRFMAYAKTPFDLTDDTDSWNPWAATNLPNYPCPIVTTEKICVNWSTRPIDMEWVSGAIIDLKQPEFIATWDGEARRIVSVGSRRGVGFVGADQRRGWTGMVTLQSMNAVALIDTLQDALIGTPIMVGKGPTGVAITPDGSKALVIHAIDSTVSILDTATKKIVGAPIPLKKSPYEIHIRKDGLKAYVTSTDTGVVTIIDVAAAKILREISLGTKTLRELVVLPNGTKAYAFDAATNVVRVIDLVAETLGQVPIPAVVSGAGRIVASPDSAFAYITGAGSNNVAVLDTKLDRIIGNPIPVGGFPIAAAIAPNGKRIYVANGFANTVSVIDTTTRQVIATVPVGLRPLGIEVTPDGTKVYVSNTFGNSMTVIDTATNAVVGKPIALPSAPTWIAFSANLPGPILETPPIPVLIDVPKGSATVEVLLYTAGRITADVVDPASKVAPVVLNGVDGTPMLVTLEAAKFGLKEGIRRIRIRCDREWVLVRICITRPALPGGLEDLSKLHDELADGLSVWGEPGAVLEPYTDYRITAEVRKTVVGVGELSGWNDPPETIRHSRRFHTDGPPGIGKPDVPAHADKLPSKTGLEDLERYVSQTIPITIVPEGARPDLQKPVYRGYDVGVKFNEDYVDRMYELAARDLAIRLHDAGDEPVRGLGGGLIVFANKWGNAATVTLTETRRQWIEVLNAATCLPKDIDVTTLPKNKTLATSDHVLAPDTLYEARLVPLLLQAPKPGGAGWATETFAPGVMMLKRTAGDAGNWTDVLIHVVVRPMPTGLTGVAFRVGSASARYVFAIDVANGKRSLTGAAGPKRESAFPYDVTKQYQLSIEAIGSRLRIEQDGELVFEVASDATSPKGSVGLFPWLASGPQRFEMLSVHDFGRGAPVAYRFPFTTSRYVDFFHQIQSHSGETWSGVLPPTFAANAIITATNANLKTPAPEPEARAYDQFADAVLGSAARQLPRRIEATRVDQGAPFALLVRGDEPIDWRRATLKVGRATAASPMLVPAGKIKIADAAFGTAQPVDVVSVLLAEPLDPTGCRIETQVPPRPLEETSQAPLLADKFAQNDLAGWTLGDEIPTMPTSATSAWSIANGELRVSNNVTVGVAPSFLGTFAAAGDAAWSDVVVRARVRCPGGGAIGVVVRGGGIDDYYRFSMDNRSSYRQLVKKIGGTFTVLWRDSVAYDPTRTYELTFIADRDVLRGYVDGVPLFVVNDTERATGIVAMYVWNGEAFFSNVRVDPISAAADDFLLDERFASGVSSRWSFEPQVVWQVVNDELLAPDALTTANSALAGDTSWSDYRVSARMLLGATGTTALAFRHQSDARNYQLRWDPAVGRLKLMRVLAGVEAVLWQSAWSPATATETLFAIDCLGASLTGYANGVRLFNVKDESIPTGRVGFRATSKTATRIRELRVAEAGWMPWYIFEQERKRDAGTRFEVRAETSSSTASATEPGTFRKFNPGVPRLPNESVALRLVDASGVVVHGRRFLPPAAFAVVPVRLMRSADGTGFVVLAQQGPLAPGTYRLSLKYERKKAGVAPDLSRGGLYTEEMATIDITI